MSNFLAPALYGYHDYVGTTGSSLKGGCGFYIKNTHFLLDLEFKIVDKDAQSENYWTELINDSGPNTIIGVFYRHPSGKMDKFMTNLETTLKKIKREKKKLSYAEILILIF